MRVDQEKVVNSWVYETDDFASLQLGEYSVASIEFAAEAAVKQFCSFSSRKFLNYLA